MTAFYGIALTTSSLDLSCCKRVSNPSQSGHSYRPDDMLEDNHIHLSSDEEACKQKTSPSEGKKSRRRSPCLFRKSQRKCKNIRKMSFTIPTSVPSAKWNVKKTRDWCGASANPGFTTNATTHKSPKNYGSYCQQIMLLTPACYARKTRWNGYFP